MFKNCLFWSEQLIVHVTFLQGFGHGLKQTVCCCVLLSVRLSHGAPPRRRGQHARRPGDALQSIPLFLVDILRPSSFLCLLQGIGKSQGKHIHLLLSLLSPPLSFGRTGGLLFFFFFSFFLPFVTLGHHDHLLDRQITMLVVKGKARYAMHSRQTVQQRDSQSFVERLVFLLVGKKCRVATTVDAAMRARAFLVAFQALLKTIKMDELPTTIRDHQRLGFQTNHTPFLLHDPLPLSRCARRALLKPLPFRKGCWDTPITLWETLGGNFQTF